jgi:hypothetical protein
VSFGKVPQQRVFSQHEAMRQDLFNITNSVVFVSGTYIGYICITTVSRLL